MRVLLQGLCGEFSPNLIWPQFIIQGWPVSGVQNEGKIKSCQFPKICVCQNTVIDNEEKKTPAVENETIYKTGAAVICQKRRWLKWFQKVKLWCKPVTKTKKTEQSGNPSQMLCCEKLIVFFCSFEEFLFVCWGIDGVVLETGILHLYILHFWHTSGHRLNEILHRASSSIHLYGWMLIWTQFKQNLCNRLFI